MKREIKFRAWDNRRKEMIAEGFSVIGEVTIFDLVGQWINEHKKPEENTLDYLLTGIDIMQFVGMTDRKGKDLYEGDIVQAYRNNKAYSNDIFLVKYSETGFTMVGDPDETKMDGIWFYDFEIIGNCFQSPGLL